MHIVVFYPHIRQLKKSIPFLTTIVFCTLLIQHIGQHCIYNLSSFKGSPLENFSEKDFDKTEEKMEEKRNNKNGNELFAYLKSSRFNSLVNGKFDVYKMVYYDPIFLDHDTPPPRSVS